MGGLGGADRCLLVEGGADQAEGYPGQRFERGVPVTVVERTNDGIEQDSNALAHVTHNGKTVIFIATRRSTCENEGFSRIALELT